MYSINICVNLEKGDGGTFRMVCKESEQRILGFINNELSDEKLTEFLEHIKTCKSCYEELEIYYTIHVALQKLDYESNASYDINKMLVDNIENKRQNLRKKMYFHIYVNLVQTVAEIAIGVCVIFQILWQT